MRATTFPINHVEVMEGISERNFPSARGATGQGRRRAKLRELREDFRADALREINLEDLLGEARALRLREEARTLRREVRCRAMGLVCARDKKMPAVFHGRRAWMDAMSARAAGTVWRVRSTMARWAGVTSPRARSGTDVYARAIDAHGVASSASCA